MLVASVFFGLSQIYVAAVAWLVLSLDFKTSIMGLFDYRPWRLLVVINALPGLAAVLGLWFFPESPKYHMAQVRHAQGLTELQLFLKIRTGSQKRWRVLFGSTQKTPGIQRMISQLNNSKSKKHPPLSALIASLY